jgi:hypothetical protein
MQGCCTQVFYKILSLAMHEELVLVCETPIPETALLHCNITASILNVHFLKQI